MLGHNRGRMLNAAQLAAGLGISGQTETQPGHEHGGSVVRIGVGCG
jgi:hypothetical protein